MDASEFGANIRCASVTDTVNPHAHEMMQTGPSLWQMGKTAAARVHHGCHASSQHGALQAAQRRIMQIETDLQNTQSAAMPQEADASTGLLASVLGVDLQLVRHLLNQGDAIGYIYMTSAAAR